jgi:DNA-binding PadR family transcriptional regulator
MFVAGQRTVIQVTENNDRGLRLFGGQEAVDEESDPDDDRRIAVQRPTASLRATEESIDRELDELVETVEAMLPVEDLYVEESIIKEELPEMLLVLISIHGEAHGKELISDLARLSGEQLSPGTVYPVLHDLEEEGLLSLHKKVRTKEYSIADEQAAQAAIERSMLRHMGFGVFINSYLARQEERERRPDVE